MLQGCSFSISSQSILNQNHYVIFEGKSPMIAGNFSPAHHLTDVHKNKGTEWRFMNR